jgi:hypothetical protein
MRHVKLVGGLAAAICVLAVAAAPAGAAHQFVASKLGKSVGRGFEEIPVEKGVTPPFEPERMQEWKLGTFRILCYKTRLNGEVTEQASEVFTTTLHFANCGWYPQRNSLHVAATFSKEGLTVRYHANGYTEAVGSGSGETYEFKNAEVLETATYVKISSTKLCKIVIPEQTIPVRAIKHPEEIYSAALYSNLEVAATNKYFFPTGKQKRIAIASEFKNLKFKYAGEGTQCATSPEFEKQAEEGGGGVAGLYKGSVEAWIPDGDLHFE